MGDNLNHGSTLVVDAQSASKPGVLPKGQNMVGPFLVVGERVESFQAKSGQKKVRRVSVLDQSEHSLINTVDWEPSETDADKLPELGKLKGKMITLGVTDMRPAFGGRLSISATLVQDRNQAKP